MTLSVTFSAELGFVESKRSGIMNQPTPAANRATINNTVTIDLDLISFCTTAIGRKTLN